MERIKIDAFLKYYISENSYSIRRCILVVKSELNKNIGQQNNCNNNISDIIIGSDIENSYESFLILFSVNLRKVEKRIMLKHTEKLTKYRDTSWEIEEPNRGTYRFLGLNNDENQKWFQAVSNELNNVSTTSNKSNILSPNKDIAFYPEKLTNTPDKDSSTEMTLSCLQQKGISKRNAKDRVESVYDLIVFQEMTSKHFLQNLLLNRVYFTSFHDSSIIMRDKLTGQSHVFETNTIKRYGSTNDYFLFELGQNSKYGPGMIALRSSIYNSRVIYDYFRDIVKKKFSNFYEKLLSQQNMQEVSTLKNNILEMDDSNTANNNKNTKDMSEDQHVYITHNEHEFNEEFLEVEKGLLIQRNNNFNENGDVEIKIELEENSESKNRRNKIKYDYTNENGEPLKRQVQPYLNDITSADESDYSVTIYSESECETDESFYKEKYVPEYLSRKINSFDKSVNGNENYLVRRMKF